MTVRMKFKELGDKAIGAASTLAIAALIGTCTTSTIRGVGGISTQSANQRVLVSAIESKKLEPDCLSDETKVQGALSSKLGPDGVKKFNETMIPFIKAYNKAVSSAKSEDDLSEARTRLAGGINLCLTDAAGYKLTTNEKIDLQVTYWTMIAFGSTSNVGSEGAIIGPKVAVLATDLVSACSEKK